MPSDTLIMWFVERFGLAGLLLAIVALIAARPHSFPWLLRRAENGQEASVRRKENQSLISKVDALAATVREYHTELHGELAAIRAEQSTLSSRMPDRSFLEATQRHLADERGHWHVQVLDERTTRNDARLNGYSERIRSIEQSRAELSLEIQGLKAGQSEILTKLTERG